MTRTNESRHIEWHETFKSNCRLDASLCCNKQRWNKDNKDKCWCECKELIDKAVRDKGHIWNPCNCERECDRSCDIGEYLVYENCKCRKKLIYKLIKQCTENFFERKIAGLALFEHGNECVCSYTICVILAAIAVTISIEIGACFACSRWYSKKILLSIKNCVLKKVLIIKQQFIGLMNGKSQTNRDQKSNLLFLQRHDQTQKFQLKLFKNRQKALQSD